MNIISRCLLMVYAFFVTVVSLFALSMTIKLSIFKSVTGFLEKEVIFYNKYTLVFFVLELFLLFASVVFLLSGFRVKKNRKAIIQKTPLGQVSISLNSIENIVCGTIRKMQLIKESKVYVESINDRVAVVIKTVVMMDTNIPALVEDIQKKSKKAIESNTDIEVDSVKVLVDDVCSMYKPRVE